VTFPAGQKLGHCIINEGTEPVQYLIIGEAKNDDIAVYPDSNKISVLAAGEIYDKSATREYWDGEYPGKQ
jgi:uncharacterized cupin superfamily protein